MRIERGVEVEVRIEGETSTMIGIGSGGDLEVQYRTPYEDDLKSMTLNLDPRESVPPNFEAPKTEIPHPGKVLLRK